MSAGAYRLRHRGIFGIQSVGSLVRCRGYYTWAGVRQSINLPVSLFIRYCLRPRRHVWAWLPPAADTGLVYVPLKSVFAARRDGGPCKACGRDLASRPINYNTAMTRAARALARRAFLVSVRWRRIYEVYSYGCVCNNRI